MVNELLDKLFDKTLTKEQLFKKIKHDETLIPDVIEGMSSEKASIRYGCGKTLMDLSREKPEKLYPYMDRFVKYLDSPYRIIIWQAMFIIANLTTVDKENKFEDVFDKYYSFINDEYMVTVANLVGHSGKIAQSKPNLIPRITKELLKVENIKKTPHLTDECKRVITEGAISSFDMFFEKVENKKMIISFVKKHKDSPRKNLKEKATMFLDKWDK